MSDFGAKIKDLKPCPTLKESRRHPFCSWLSYFCGWLPCFHGWMSWFFANNTCSFRRKACFCNRNTSSRHRKPPSYYKKHYFCHRKSCFSRKKPCFYDEKGCFYRTNSPIFGVKLPKNGRFEWVYSLSGNSCLSKINSPLDNTEIWNFYFYLARYPILPEKIRWVNIS